MKPSFKILMAFLVRRIKTSIKLTTLVVSTKFIEAGIFIATPRIVTFGPGWSIHKAASI